MAIASETNKGLSESLFTATQVIMPQVSRLHTFQTTTGGYHLGGSHTMSESSDPDQPEMEQANLFPTDFDLRAFSGTFETFQPHPLDNILYKKHAVEAMTKKVVVPPSVGLAPRHKLPRCYQHQGWLFRLIIGLLERPVGCVSPYGLHYAGLYHGSKKKPTHWDGSCASRIHPDRRSAAL